MINPYDGRRHTGTTRSLLRGEVADLECHRGKVISILSISRDARKNDDVIVGRCKCPPLKRIQSNSTWLDGLVWKRVVDVAAVATTLFARHLNMWVISKGDVLGRIHKHAVGQCKLLVGCGADALLHVYGRGVIWKDLKGAEEETGALAV